ncbi:MAG TPA: hypothetical protein K8V90_00835 [Romboutsia timonensis]|uniref:Uncharacterized protein n=1 Tax=Romboutsia timonensis TaxID=1776391 RepID=A0A921MZN0_9FIRM|nr:hypothetical protein [uncultured Romboutsia sp.]HJG95629.1 hypothetical protein [Romboutsia timonensis]
MKNITFGNLIEKLLYISNQKKSSLAKFIGYDVSYINKWILSTYLPSSKRINEICKNISDFIIQSLDESGLINLIDYFEIPSDSSKEYISQYIETILKEVYLDTINLNNKSVQNLPKSTHSEEYYNSFSMVKPNIIYNTFFNELNNMSDKEDSLEILISLNLMYLNHKDKIALSDLKEFLYKISKKTKVKASFLIGLGGDDKNNDVINTLLGINLIATYPSLNFKIYNCKVNSNTVVFAIKDKFLSTNIFFEEGECLFTTSSKDRRLVEEFYSNLKYTLKNKGNLLCYRKDSSSMIEDQTYIQYIMNNDLRCLLGSINEFFMPPDLFMEIAQKLFGHNKKIINELQKINLFLHNVTYKSKLRVLIYESELRKYMSSGKLHFFNTPVTLTFKERERHIEYIEKILTESNDVEIRLVDGDFVDDFKNKENPSLYLSRNLKFTKVHPDSGKNDYFIISDTEFKNMCTDLFDKLWNTRTDIVISNKEEMLDRIARSISYTRLISESFGENIE